VEIVDMCRKGFRINDASIAELTKRVTDEMKQWGREDVTTVIQLLDNSVYQVAGTDGSR
jgi:predicted nucleic-acid-binding protein